MHVWDNNKHDFSYLKLENFGFIFKSALQKPQFSYSDYFFMIKELDRDFEEDRLDTILPGLWAALSHAERMIKTLQDRGGYKDPGLMMFVRDESGQMVLSLPFIPGGD